MFNKIHIIILFEVNTLILLSEEEVEKFNGKLVFDTFGLVESVVVNLSMSASDNVAISSLKCVYYFI